ncbi:MAG: energy-coupling factor transporter ATPase [Clostridia bacterium]|nr:energy-coupling factor transporter ATPase [Clostridia bacterium]
MPLILAEHLSYTYTPGGVFEKNAVRDVNFTIEDGTFCGIIGHTGSGKTTLVQMLAGLVRPTEGKVLINGLDVHDKKIRLNELKGKVGLVFQYPEYQLFGETVLEDVMFGPLNLGLSEADARKKAKAALRDTGVDASLFDSSPFELSGGQKRRIAIAGVLALSPEILILDEPTAGLDPMGRDEILSCISELHKREKITVLLISHSMEDMAKYAQQILVMDGGKLCMHDTVENVFSHGEKLREMGLDVPDITRVILSLREKGVNISPDIYTLSAAKEAILRIWREKKCSEI